MVEPTRREALALAALGASSGFTPAARQKKAADLIKQENAKPGTTDWQLTYIKFDAKAKLRQSLIEGFCTHTSVAPGESIGFRVSTDPATAFTVDVYRMGYYGGAGARLMTSLGPFDGKPEPLPKVGENRLRECDWETRATLRVPKDWPSGVYLAKLSAAKHRYQSYCTFIVRDDRPADILFQCSTNTWAAYNKWPDKH